MHVNLGPPDIRGDSRGDHDVCCFSTSSPVLLSTRYLYLILWCTDLVDVPPPPISMMTRCLFQSYISADCYPSQLATYYDRQTEALRTTSSKRSMADIPVHKRCRHRSCSSCWICAEREVNPGILVDGCITSIPERPSPDGCTGLLRPAV